MPVDWERSSNVATKKRSELEKYQVKLDTLSGKLSTLSVLFEDLVDEMWKAVEIEERRNA